jgi:hypothetical protein
MFKKYSKKNFFIKYNTKKLLFISYGQKIVKIETL